ncbi:Slam-dependent surface lipoprotein [Neisseria flavescens]|uniref:Slam-dependent surface lipoprotein n=1 Tax=Neisseria flavescens TaxID=484 RepID=UPI00124219CB|nr:Slam-dependent surface lipoprotein [Neisseria flavescens]
MELVKTVAVLSVAFAASSVFALPKGFQANPTGATTESIQVEGVKHIGVTLENEGEHKGKASIFVSDTKAVSGTPEKGIANNKPVSFAKIDATANKYFVKTFAHGILGKDKNGVTVANLYRMNGAWHLIPKMPDHSHLGRLSYSKVGNMDVYFGDWSAVPSGAAVGTKGTNYTAFYSGTGRTTNLPTTGTATYTVKGINQYHTQNTALLNGTLKADFGKRRLNGEMKRTGLTVAVNNAAINTAQASFEGKATANKVAGTTRGHFFGNQGAAIAGVADFGLNHAYNTAFGGTKTGK